MEHKHTPEPWKVIDVVGINGHRIAICAGVDLDGCKTIAEILASMLGDARRIVACVNACAGIATMALEHRSHLLKAEDCTLMTLRQQRDELLAALNWIVKNPGAHHNNVHYVAKDAISKVGVVAS